MVVPFQWNKGRLPYLAGSLGDAFFGGFEDLDWLDLSGNGLMMLDPERWQHRSAGFGNGLTIP